MKSAEDDVKRPSTVLSRDDWSLCGIGMPLLWHPQYRAWWDERAQRLAKRTTAIRNTVVLTGQFALRLKCFSLAVTITDLVSHNQSVCQCYD